MKLPIKCLQNDATKFVLHLQLSEKLISFTVCISFFVKYIYTPLQKKNIQNFSLPGPLQRTISITILIIVFNIYRRAYLGIRNII